MTTREELLHHLAMLKIQIDAQQQQMEDQNQRVALWRSHWQLCNGLPGHETPLTTLYRIWHTVAPEDRLRFLVEMLTPNERRALQFGFEDEEPSP